MADRLERLEQWLVASKNLNREVIIIHDIQDSKTGPQLTEMSNRLNDRKIKIIESALGSPGKARNKGLEVARGNWIVFWDSDDIADVTEVFYAISENKEAQVIVCRFSEFNVETRSIKVSLESSQNLFGLGINPGLWRMIFRREEINGKKFGALRMAEDQLFLSNIASDSMNLTYSNRIVYQYFIGQPDQLTNSKIDINDLIEAFEKIFMNSKNSFGVNQSLHLFMSARILLTVSKRFKFTGLIHLLVKVRRNKINISFTEAYKILKIVARILIWKTWK
jgi:glycosyltransferase involved in cell wall biosynthesis